MEHQLGEHNRLYELGDELLRAAEAYWEEYNRTMGKDAVVWLQSDTGQLVVFTRGEYADQLKQTINNL